VPIRFSAKLLCAVLSRNAFGLQFAPKLPSPPAHKPVRRVRVPVGARYCCRRRPSRRSSSMQTSVCTLCGRRRSRSTSRSEWSAKRQTDPLPCHAVTAPSDVLHAEQDILVYLCCGSFRSRKGWSRSIVRSRSGRPSFSERTAARNRPYRPTRVACSMHQHGADLQCANRHCTRSHASLGLLL
jgi:hypothetical protein